MYAFKIIDDNGMLPFRFNELNFIGSANGYLANKYNNKLEYTLFNYDRTDLNMIWPIYTDNNLAIMNIKSTDTFKRFWALMNMKGIKVEYVLLQDKTG